MPDAKALRFSVACRWCGLVLLSTALIADPEIATIEAHARCCGLREKGTANLPLGALLFHVRVTVEADPL